MTVSQIEILLVLLATVLLFLWGRWRHDLVALAALMACVLLGLVSAEQAFLGFGHPAVITVACVLIATPAGVVRRGTDNGAAFGLDVDSGERPVFARHHE